MPANPGFDSSGVEKGEDKSSNVNYQGPTFSKSRRTRCEKGLIFVTIVFALAIIALVVVLVVKLKKSDDEEDQLPEVCTSSDCVQTAAQVLDKIDASVNPCENFYQFACGAWKRKNVIPEDKTIQSVFGGLVDDVQVTNKYLMEHTEMYKDFPAVQKAKDMYASCTNLDLIEQLDLNVSFALLNELGGWPVLGSNPGGNWVEADFDIVKLLQSLRKYNNAPIINLYVYSDVKDSENYIIYMDQPYLGLPGRDYYLKPEEPYLSMREAYVVLAKSIAELFGADPAAADADMRKMLELETELANITMKSEDRRDNEALYNKMTLTQLALNFTEPSPGDNIQFTWLNYVTSIMDIDGVKIAVNSSEEIVVEAVPYYEKVFNVLQKYTKRELANYLVWYIMKNRASNLPKRFRDQITDYNEVLYGVTTSRARWRTCLDYTINYMGMAVGHMFVREKFDETAKDIALDMISNLRNAFNEILNELDWMDEPTKVLAREKAKAIGEWIGYPDGLLNRTVINELYENYTVDANAYFENVLGNLKRSSAQALRKLRDKYNKNVNENRVCGPVLSTPPVAANRELYFKTVFPAGILQPPFYSKSQPKSMNYGGIGMVIGHEITHGFDDRGRQYDKDGNLVQWWTEDIINNFKEKAQCIVDQYGNFLVTEANMTINGINTQGENIADNGGLKQSFRAYRKWVSSRGSEEPLLPGVEYNHNQLFFINNAQIWCNNRRTRSMINALVTGVHSPGEFRVIGSLQNSPDFAAAFNCQPNAYMNPRNKCYVW